MVRRSQYPTACCRYTAIAKLFSDIKCESDVRSRGRVALLDVAITSHR